MATIASLSLDLKTNTAEFTRGLKRADAGAVEFARSVEQSASRAHRSLAQAGRAASSDLAGFARGALQSATGQAIYNTAARSLSALGGVFKTGIAGAADLGETMSKTSVIFGGSADTIVSEADRMAQAFGTSKNEFITAAGNLGAVFKGMGKGQAEAAALGTSLAKLGMDMASFDNTSNAEAFSAISSALRGEMDPIEKFRVFLSADKVEAEALASGLARSKGEITDTAKKMAIMNLITKQTADAHGDLARTQSGVTNQGRKLQGNLANLATDMGKSLLPAVNSGIGALNGFAEASMKAFADRKGSVEGMVQALALEIDAVGLLGKNWASAMEVMQVNAGVTVHNVQEEFRTLAVNVGEIFTWMSRNVMDTAKEVAGLTEDLVALGKAGLDWAGGGKFQPDLKAMGPPAANPFKLSTPKLLDRNAVVQAKQNEFAEKAMQPTMKAAAAPAAPTPAKPTQIASKDQASMAAPAKPFDLKDFARDFRESLKSPLEVLREEAAHLTEAFQAGMINPMELKKGRERLNLRAQEETQPQLAGAAKLGSQEFYSSITRAMTAAPGNMVTPYQRETFGEMKKQTAYQKRQVELIEKSNKANEAGRGLDREFII